MKPHQMTILVTGATGRQGGALARTLLKRGHKVRAFTRKPSSPAAKELKRLGAELIAGSFDDRRSLEKAVTLADAVFAVTTPYEAGPEAEKRQGIAVGIAAWTAGVKHLVYTSVAGANRSTGIPHFDSKYEVEQYIQSLGVPFTIIAPVTFMDNVLGPSSLKELQQGRLTMALPQSRNIQQIVVEDIANFAAFVLENRKRFLGARIDIASDELTGAQSAELLSRAIGKRIDYVEIYLDHLRAVNGDFAKMFEWLDRMGYRADIAALRRDYPEVGWHSYEEWVMAQNWKVLLNGHKAV